ncbi:hypothetical protein [Streptomyces pinistramenti]|uniref:hypothetical protein n=1 Tax=Streptomyces pinistramenti TaxID=2884812 RepID=UPI001D06A505|nr:hypothetical protein [Streptomyces pinistramenti]MCB5908038.1 hypothetical protein [Streptomyces pinistramenti]
MDGWIRVPVGGESGRWDTRGSVRRVLFVVHNVTSATRLLDVLPLFRGDWRLQMLATCTGSSPFQAGVRELLADVGVPVLPWAQALRTPVDLAISASFGGELHALDGKLAVLSHGVGYNKTLARPGGPEARRPGGPEARRPGGPERSERSEARRPGAVGGPERSELSGGGADPVFGMSGEWLLVDGAPIADAMVLSHPEQVERLRAACPPAAHTAALAGDPCFDRLLAARSHRARFRRALGVRSGQRLVVLNSTWNPESLFGDGGGEDLLPSLLPRLTGELPADDFRLAAVLHPNIWLGHGPGQVRAWLDRARRGGLALLDPLEGWRQALLAADLVIGDHGSVTYYAAALGTPVILGAAPLNGLDPASPVADFVRTAPRLDPRRPLRRQLEAAITGHRPLPGPAELTTSVPGKSADLLRALFYDLIGIAEPDRPAVLDPLPLPPYEPPQRTAPLRVLTLLTREREVTIRRFAEPPHEPEEAMEDAVEDAMKDTAEGVIEEGSATQGGRAGRCGRGVEEAHTAVHEDTADREAVATADVIFRYGAADDPRLGPPESWGTEVLAQWPNCTLAAYISGPGVCTVRTRAGDALRLSAAPSATDPAAHASALLAALAAGTPLPDLIAHGLTVRTARTTHTVKVTDLRPPRRTPH